MDLDCLVDSEGFSAPGSTVTEDGHVYNSFSIRCFPTHLLLPSVFSREEPQRDVPFKNRSEQLNFGFVYSLSLPHICLGRPHFFLNNDYCPAFKSVLDNSKMLCLLSFMLSQLKIMKYIMFL